MKKRSNLAKSVFLLVLLFLTSLGIVSAEELTGWDDARNEAESSLWEKTINEWGSLMEKWGEKRENCAFNDNREEYCNEKGCWGEDLFYWNFKGKNGEEWRISKDSSRAEVKTANYTWSNRNDGQGLEYTHQDGTVWNSRNFGQILEYKDAPGNTWRIGNRGQSISFTGINGDSWTSRNNGQGLEYQENGVEWQSSNYGQSEQYKDASGEEWRGSFDSED